VQLLISSADELPIYRQLMRQISERIAAGLLQSGNKLPSHRDLAEQLVIAPLTVKKAYDELEILGYLETQRGRGTFVVARLPKVNAAEQREQLRLLARRLLAQAYLAGWDLPDAINLLRKTDGELTGRADQPTGVGRKKEP